MHEVIVGNFEYIGFKRADVFGCNVFSGDLIRHVFMLTGMHLIGTDRKKSFRADLYVSREPMFGDVEQLIIPLQDDN